MGCALNSVMSSADFHGIISLPLPNFVLVEVIPRGGIR